MRILIVSQYYYPENVTVTPIAEDLVKKGHEVTVLTGRPNYGLGGIPKEYRKLKREVRNGVKIHRVPLVARKKGRLSLVANYLSFNFASRLFLRRFKGKFDVVYSVTLSPVMSVQGAGEFAKAHRLPHVLHCLDLWPESAVVAGNVKSGSLAYRILYRWSKRIYLGASKILISSPSFRDYFVSTLRMGHANIFYVPQPPLVEMGEDNTHPDLGEHFNLVYVGNVGRLQLLDEVIEAISFLPRETNIHFHVVGDGSGLEVSMKKAKELLVEDKVSFYGTKPASENHGFYSQADMILVSLRSGVSPVYRTIPNKVLSSLAEGKPILAVIDGDGKAVLEQIGGSLISKEGSKNIAASLLKAMALPRERLEAMGRANREAYEERYSFERVMVTLEEAITSSRKDFKG